MLNSIFALVAISVLIPALILLAKIYKFIRLSDIPILCSISAISLSLIFLIGTLFAFILEDLYSINNHEQYNPIIMKIDLFLNIFSQFFMISAFTIDLYKCLVYLLNTGFTDSNG